MTELRNAWAKVGESVDRLGLKVKLHVKEELSEREAGSVWERLGSTLEELLDGLGDAYEDPIVRNDAKSVADALVGALDATATTARNRLPGSGR